MHDECSQQLNYLNIFHKYDGEPMVSYPETLSVYLAVVLFYVRSLTQCFPNFFLPGTLRGSARERAEPVGLRTDAQGIQGFRESPRGTL